MKKRRERVCVVGGAGHAGAPLAVALASAGIRTLVYDRNPETLAQLANGRMPFKESKGSRGLRRALKSGNLRCTGDAEELQGARDVILAIDTSPHEFVDPQNGKVLACLATILPHLGDGICLMLRSSVAPGFTEFLDAHLRSTGKDALVAYCPERAAQGAALDEFASMPQIVGGCNPAAVKRAKALFRRIAPAIVTMSPLEAEYAKLICNAYRYVQFAATNQFAVLVEAAGLDYHRLLAKTKRGYSRLAGMPRAGFAGGPCLAKDTLALFPSKHGGTLGALAAKINQSYPDFIVARLGSEIALDGARIGILGMAFKAESDDARGSLSYRLAELLRLRGALVSCSDEYVTDPAFVAKERLVAECDVIVIATPHRAYRRLRIPVGKRVIDTCDCLG